MAEQVLKMRIQLRRATTAEWEANKSVVPAAGEPCFDLELNTLKIGDGVILLLLLPMKLAPIMNTLTFHTKAYLQLELTNLELETKDRVLL